MPRLLFLAGSAGKNSLNKKLARYACETAAGHGADVEFIDLKAYEMPLYCTDWELENGIPDNAKKLKKLFQDADGFFIASPEYNSTFTPLIKNTIDWMSRPHEKDEKPLSAYRGKVAAIAATSPGPLGGLRGLTPLRTMLSNIGVHVIPTQVAIGGADALDENGKPTQDMHLSLLKSEIKQFVETAEKLNA